MIGNKERITLDKIDPKAFVNYTTVVTETNPPKREFVVRVESSDMNEDGMHITTLTRLLARKGLPDTLKVDTNTFLNGGELGGFIFPGVSDLVEGSVLPVEDPLVQRQPETFVAYDLPFPVRVKNPGIPIKAIL